MREILPGIFMWGSTYADRPWDLNGYAIALDACTVLVDPPAPGEDDWASFDLMKPITKIILTNRDHVRDIQLTVCGKFWNWVRGVSIGHGYKPHRAFIGMVGFVVLGSANDEMKAFA